jgi:hypothetical protein
MKPHMHPFFDAMQDIIRGSEPAPAAAPRRRWSCNACMDSGELSEGGPCNWCAVDEPQCDEED